MNLHYTTVCCIYTHYVATHRRYSSLKLFPLLNVVPNAVEELLLCGPEELPQSNLESLGAL